MKTRWHIALATLKIEIKSINGCCNYGDAFATEINATYTSNKKAVICMQYLSSSVHLSDEKSHTSERNIKITIRVRSQDASCTGHTEGDSSFQPQDTKYASSRVILSNYKSEHLLSSNYSSKRSFSYLMYHDTFMWCVQRRSQGNKSFEVKTHSYSWKLK